jgi:hypothetical protein
MIHNVLLTGTYNLVDGLILPRTLLKARTETDKAPESHTSESVTSDTGSIVAPPHSFVPRSVPGEVSGSGLTKAVLHRLGYTSRNQMHNSTLRGGIFSNRYGKPHELKQ